MTQFSKKGGGKFFSKIVKTRGFGPPPDPPPKKKHHATSSNLYWSFYPHRLRELVSPVWGIFVVVVVVLWLVVVHDWLLVVVFVVIGGFLRW